jgi:transposase InsO family protein
LAAVIDLFSRQVVGWSMQPHLQISLVKDALDMAWFRRRPEAGLIFHSDSGSQYCSNDFQDAMGKWQMRSSMSRKGHCCDNAPAESFWGRLKTASLYGDKFAIRREAMDAVLECGWLSAITDACIRRSATSARCNLSNAATRYSAKRPRKPWAKNSTKRGQDQACDQ